MTVLCQDNFLLLGREQLFCWKIVWLQFLVLIMGSGLLSFISVKLDKITFVVSVVGGNLQSTERDQYVSDTSVCSDYP